MTSDDDLRHDAIDDLMSRLDIAVQQWRKAHDLDDMEATSIVWDVAQDLAEGAEQRYYEMQDESEND